MLVSDIVRRVRNSAGDTAVLQFTQTMLTDWINDAIRECVLSNDLLQHTLTTATVVDQETYTLPTDPAIFKIHSIHLDNYKLEMMTLQEWEEQHASEPNDGASGDPFQAYIYGQEIHLFPTPSRVQTMKVFYTQLPEAIEYTESPEAWTPDTPDIPEQFHNRIVTYCLAQVAFQDDMHSQYQSLMQEFYTGVKDLGNIKDEQQDLYPMIAVSSRDEGDHYYPNDMYF